MDQPKPPESRNQLMKLDTFTIMNKRFTLSVLMNIGFMIMFSGITFTHGNKCWMKSLEKQPEDPYIHTSSYSIGYLIIQIPAVWISLKFSPITWFGRSILVYSVLLFVTALLGTFHYGILIVVKFLEGVLSGLVFVVSHAVWKNWAPAAERSTLVTFALAGGYLGMLFGELMPILCSELPGWILIICIIGIVSIIWWFVWESMVYETPIKHRTITEKEYNQIHPIIQEELNPTADVSCKQIIFSIPFLVLVLVNILRSWNSRLYIYPIEQMNIIRFIKVISFPLAGYLADVLLRKTTLTITNVRKLYITGVFLLEGINLLLISHFKMGIGLFLTSFLMQILFNAAHAATIVNALDIAPSHAGVTAAITNFISHIVYEMSFKIELYLHEINWYGTVNFISIIAHILVAIIYGIYGSANPITVKK